MPVLERSAGISAALRQPPLAYSSKSSPGCTDLSRPARSMPITGAAGAVAAGVAVAESSAEGVGVRLQATQAQMASARSEEHTSELQSLMRISYAVFCLKKKKNITNRI